MQNLQITPNTKGPARDFTKAMLDARFGQVRNATVPVKSLSLIWTRTIVLHTSVSRARDLDSGDELSAIRNYRRERGLHDVKSTDFKYQARSLCPALRRSRMDFHVVYLHRS